MVVSAGAIYGLKGITDSWSEELKILNCLGFIPGVCCPHYLEEKERRPKVFEFINTKKLKTVMVLTKVQLFILLMEFTPEQ